LDENSTLILKRYFKEYYFKFSGNIKSPTEIESREFGYFPFGGGMIRHLSFKDVGTLRALLVKEAPAGVYCSNSLYSDPSLEMHKKGWIKAELIFDIDADALKLPCKTEHDVWFCKSCNRKEFGLRPETCPSCGGNKLLESSWACPVCLEGTKRETFKLMEFLESDFGIPGRSIKVYFSGNAGYHILVSGDHLESIDQQGRAEIADYLTSQGLLPHAFKTSRLSESDPGWRGRIARYIRNLPPESPPFKHNEFGKRLRELVDDMKEEKADKFILEAARANSVRIDVMVTADIHRIFRMPETLNNKTGLVKRECTDLSTFDPLVDAIALSHSDEDLEIRVDIAPKIDLGEGSYGPYRNEVVTVPRYVGVYLIAKGAGKLTMKNEAQAKAS
jgi:DNA primase small subunit